MKPTAHDIPAPGRSRCPVCGSLKTHRVIQLEDVPILCHKQYRSRQQALMAPKAVIRLISCHACGHLYNAAVDADRLRYDDGYENSLHFSPRFRRYQQELAAGLVERHGLFAKEILEVGCGDGTFLKLICNMGRNRGIGIDPGARDDPALVPAGIEVIRAKFTPTTVSGRADLVCCRHVLEHMPAPQPFLEALLKAMRPNETSAVYVEVPNGDRLVRDRGIWDLIYEHCAVFTSASLQRLFHACGCDGAVIREGFAGQFLCAEFSAGDMAGRGTSMPIGDPHDLSRQAAALARHYRRCVAAWRQRLRTWAAHGQKAVVWGAGSKGISFLNAIGRNSAIESVVDVNPRKHGTFIPGTGQKIVAAESLTSNAPDWVIVMNSVYRTEIHRMLSQMGLEERITLVTGDDGSDAVNARTSPRRRRKNLPPSV